MSQMVKIRNVRGVRFVDRSPDVWMSDEKHQAVLYDEGVQFEDEDGATLFTWDEIDLLFV